MKTGNSLLQCRGNSVCAHCVVLWRTRGKNQSSQTKICKQIKLLLPFHLITVIMIAQLALALLCLVAAWMPLVCLSLLKGWSWSRTLCSWRLTFPTLSFSSHRHREISSESVSRPRLTATTFSGQCCTHPHHEQECSELNEDDVKVLVSHIDETDGGPPWKLMMERSTPTLTYQAWYRDPPVI